jgi:hypothetical protein
VPFIVNQQLGGESLSLLLFPHNWKKEFLLDVAYPSGIEETLSGEEDRFPEAAAIRLTGHYHLQQTGPALQELRELRATYAGGLVAAPLYCEAYQASLYTTKARLDSAYVINYDAAQNYQIYPGDSLPGTFPYPTAAPLIVGKLATQGTLAAFDFDKSQAGYTIVEDAPIAFGHTAKSSLLPASWPTSLRPNWKSPYNEDIQNALKRESYGQNRQTAVTGKDYVPRLVRKFAVALTNGDQIRDLYDFVSSRKGVAEAFSAPPHFAPGTPSLNAPHATTCRFTSPRIRLSFKDRDLATTTISITQLPWEISPSRIYSLPRAVWLAKLEYKVDVPQFHYFTTADKDVPYAGKTYLPGYIEPGRLSETLTGWASQSYQLKSHATEDNPLVAIHSGDREAELELTLYLCDPDDPDATAVERFRGLLRQTKSESETLTGRFIVAGGALEEELGHYVYKPDCNAAVFSPACGVSKAGFTTAMTVAAIGDRTLDLDTLTAFDPGYFSRGFVEIGTGPNFQRRAILDSQVIAGGQRLTLDRDFRDIAVLDSASVVPGCNGERSDCAGKFGRYPSMPAHPLGPRDNISIKAFDAASIDAGGKK